MPFDYFTLLTTKEVIVNEFNLIAITFQFNKTHLVSENALLGVLGGDIVLSIFVSKIFMSNHEGNVISLAVSDSLLSSTLLTIQQCTLLQIDTILLTTLKIGEYSERNIILQQRPST